MLRSSEVNSSAIKTSLFILFIHSLIAYGTNNHTTSKMFMFLTRLSRSRALIDIGLLDCIHVIFYSFYSLCNFENVSI